MIIKRSPKQKFLDHDAFVIANRTDSRITERKAKDYFPDRILLHKTESKDSAETSVANSYAAMRMPIRRMKEVRFNPHVTFSETLHHMDYTLEERYQSWYRKTDLLQMRKGFLREEMAKEKEEDDDRSSVMFERRSLRNASRKAVMEEQQKILLQHRLILHDQDGCSYLNMLDEEDEIRNEDEAIASCYLIFSKICAFEAHNRALTAEVEAFRPTTLYDNETSKSDDNRLIKILRLKSKRGKEQQGYDDDNYHHHHHNNKSSSNHSFSTLLQHGEEFLESFVSLACTT